jgi:transposase
MAYKIGVDKKQATLFPITLDQYIPENHICRIILAFIMLLDMVSLGFKYSELKKTGAPPYDPRMMLGLYIYGFLNRIRSSRRLEAETTRNVEVMWLMDDLRPDDKTISNFRKDNKKALKKAFRQFNLMLSKLNLFGGETTATDSSKFRANSSRNNNHNEKSVEKQLSRLDSKIEEYMTLLDKGDEEDAKENIVDGEAITKALAHLREHKDDYEVFLKQVEVEEEVAIINPVESIIENENNEEVKASVKAQDSEEVKKRLEQLKECKRKYEELSKRIEIEGEVSTVDPDARLMRSGGDARKIDSCYNVHIIVDSKHKLIVDFEVTDCSSDSGSLHELTESAKEIMGVETLSNLSDKGYYDGEDIAACEASGVSCLVAKPRPGGTKKPEDYSRVRFVYDKDNDCYVCPDEALLHHVRDKKHDSGKVSKVYSNKSSCKECSKKDDCTKSDFREIVRSPFQDVLDVVDERTNANKDLYGKRKEIVEHPFGTIKSVWGYKQFLCRGKAMVVAETALACLAYNMRRVINIFAEKGESLIAAVTAVMEQMA